MVDEYITEMFAEEVDVVHNFIEGDEVINVVVFRDKEYIVSVKEKEK